METAYDEDHPDYVRLNYWKKKDQVAAAGSASAKPNVKILVALFLIFMVVVSDMFTNNIVSCFGESAVRGRAATPWGVMIQGIFLIIFYIMFTYLVSNGIL